MTACLGCGGPLTRSHQAKYCSNKCQQVYERRLMTEVWLATGQAKIASDRGHFVRTYLAEDQGDLCALCGVEATWQGLPLVFVLDHIDGDSTNNRRANLRLVCPNCDSQLPTFKARNKGNGRRWRRERYANGQSY